MKQKQKYNILPAILFLFFVALPTMAHAGIEYRERNSSHPYRTYKTTYIDVTTGIRVDQFDWNVASDLTGISTPNILSELTWEDVKLFEVRGKIRHLRPFNTSFLRGNIVLEAELSGGSTFSGDNQDSDYLGDNRTLEFSRSNNTSDSGYSLGGAVATGYQFSIAQKVRPGTYSFFTMTPLVGYSWDRQLYKMQDGYQTIPPNGPFANLDSEYLADWMGPFVGLEAEFEKNRHLFSLRFEHHFLDYYGEAVWNLRSDLKQDPSFEQSATGSGTEIHLNYTYAMDSSYEFVIDLSHTSRSAEDGYDTAFFSNGSVSSKKLNEVNDSSNAIMLGLRHTW